MLLFDSYINQSVVALRANTEIISDMFLFFDLERRYDQFRQISDSHSSRGSLTTKLLANVRTIVPPSSLITVFDRVTNPSVERIRQNLLQSRTLAALRDGLLPKLMTGEVRVNQVEEAVAHAL